MPHDCHRTSTTPSRHRWLLCMPTRPELNVSSEQRVRHTNLRPWQPRHHAIPRDLRLNSDMLSIASYVLCLSVVQPARQVPEHSCTCGSLALPQAGLLCNRDPTASVFCGLHPAVLVPSSFERLYTQPADVVHVFRHPRDCHCRHRLHVTSSCARHQRTWRRGQGSTRTTARPPLPVVASTQSFMRIR